MREERGVVGGESTVELKGVIDPGDRPCEDQGHSGAETDPGSDVLPLVARDPGQDNCVASALDA
jgi:hypothetical protein